MTPDKQGDWPAISEALLITGENKEAIEFYWHRACAEMEKRGHLELADALILELFVMASTHRDLLLSAREQLQPEHQIEADKMIQDNRDHLSDLMDLMLLPPEFAHTCYGE